MTPIRWYIAALVVGIIASVLFAVKLGKNGNQKSGGKKSQGVTPVWLRNLPQGWSAKRIAGWAFGIFLMFELIFLVFDIPNLSLIRKLVDVAYRNDPVHTTENIKQTAMEEEINPFREELDRIDNLEKQNYQSYIRAKKIESQIANIEAKYDLAQKSDGVIMSLPATEALLKSAMMFCEKPDGKKWVLRAEVKKLNEHELVIYYLYSDEHCGKSNVGVIKCLRSEKNQSYIGTWRDDAYGTAGEIELQPNYANGEICCFTGTQKASGSYPVDIKTEIKTNPLHSHSRMARSHE